MLGRSRCIHQIGMVHHERFKQSCQDETPTEIAEAHARNAGQHYRQALTICPPAAFADLGTMHYHFGHFCLEVGGSERARDHYERALLCFEQCGDHYNTGSVRYSLAFMYLVTEEQEPTRRRDLLRRAEAYAQASLRDFKFYQGRAADLEARAQRLIDVIAQALGGVGPHPIGHRLTTQNFRLSERQGTIAA